MTPPSGSIYAQFVIQNKFVSEDQNEIVSLQYSHTAPNTTATLETLNAGNTSYSDPTTVTLSAVAASGYTVTNTYYTIDGGVQQAYTAPFTVSGTGSHTLKYWSVDNSGVQESQKTKTFTITPSYNLSGVVYIDVNQNGVQDLGENGYNGASISLDTGESVTTNNNGEYIFSNVVSDTYVETLTVPSGYIATTSNPVTIPLTANTAQNFGIAAAPTNTPIPTATETPTATPTVTNTPTPTSEGYSEDRKDS